MKIWPSRQVLSRYQCLIHIFGDHGISDYFPNRKKDNTHKNGRHICNTI